MSEMRETEVGATIGTVFEIARPVVGSEAERLIESKRIVRCAAIVAVARIQIRVRLDQLALRAAMNKHRWSEWVLDRYNLVPAEIPGSEPDTTMYLLVAQHLRSWRIVRDGNFEGTVGDRHLLGIL